MSHVEMADKLLIKPTGWARPTPTSGRHLGGTAGCNEPPITMRVMPERQRRAWQQPNPGRKGSLT
ncbi:hypothetical protein, partial [Streptomyces sp. NPDC059262]|uniref:hypothetical protein n=1 Tax=Streptomyces sp. NPDC059262 TaxID=3346797 RepID=UPI0036B80C67